jgi:hypothetical protein
VKSLCIVPCGQGKIWGKYPLAGAIKARDAYTGQFARKCMEYAERFYPNSWLILSAKFGFITPDFIINSPYNISFKVKKSNPISTDQLIDQIRKNRLDDYEKIIALGGKDYVEKVREAFQGRGISNPLKGCKGIGYMMQRLKTAMGRGVPLGDAETSSHD